MVKYTRKATYSKYKKNNIRRIMYNYFKTKLSCVDRILLDDNDMKLASTNGTNRNIRAYLTGCNEWQYFSKIFHTMKITGLLMETIPGIQASNPETTPVMPGSYQLGFLPVASDSNSAAIADTNASIVLSVVQNQRKYISFHGGLNGWLDIGSLENNLVALIAVAASALPQNTGCVWTLKLTFYVTFKNPK